jgi:hypothetical protein
MISFVPGYGVKSVTVNSFWREFFPEIKFVIVAPRKVGNVWTNYFRNSARSASQVRDKEANRVTPLTQSKTIFWMMPQHELVRHPRHLGKSIVNACDQHAIVTSFFGSIYITQISLILATFGRPISKLVKLPAMAT